MGYDHRFPPRMGIQAVMQRAREALSGLIGGLTPKDQRPRIPEEMGHGHVKLVRREKRTPPSIMFVQIILDLKRYLHLLGKKSGGLGGLRLATRHNDRRLIEG
jgi:hypothetical protein